MNLTAWLLAMVGPLALRILSALGLSLVAVGGLSIAAAAVKALVMSNIGQFPATAVQLLGLYGVWECLGLVFGALTFVLTWKGTAGAWKLART